MQKRTNSSATVEELQENYSSGILVLLLPVAEVELHPSQNTSHHKGLEAISILIADRAVR